MYVSGGRDGDSNLYNTIHEYNPTSDVWLLKGNMTAGLCAHGMCQDGTHIYVIGGESRNQNGEPNIKASFRRIDVSGEQLKQRKLHAVPYFLAQTSAICYGKYLFVVGGYGRKSDGTRMQNMQDMQDVILTYHIEDKKWYEHKLIMPRGLQDCACALLTLPHTKIS